jgi:hypothetical protein
LIHLCIADKLLRTRPSTPYSSTSTATICAAFTRRQIPPNTSAYFMLGVTISAAGGSVQYRWYLEESCYMGSSLIRDPCRISAICDANPCSHFVANVGLEWRCRVGGEWSVVEWKRRWLILISVLCSNLPFWRCRVEIKQYFEIKSTEGKYCGYV